MRHSYLTIEMSSKGLMTSDTRFRCSDDTKIYLLDGC